MKSDLRHLDIIIGRNLKQLRLSKGMTQSNLAEALGLTFQQVQKYETGANRISGSRLLEIARILQIDLAMILPMDGHTKRAPQSVVRHDTSRLLRSFEAITDPKLRLAILRLVQNMARETQTQNQRDG